ncbi:LuxR C-terminal-related transcriptional regulator [Streptomyces dysideae]|uniref:LuxR family transcriptional regulator n=1 Tax=Streptomyces dysideae TaxID=909626 RepID=A0A101UZB0_9ACTN|nr:response regulator transcription factor [Streptomyces dysideae]KUO19526.1 LuxR family transcriptional regulator [Streptomyces dysideae]
MINVLVVHAQTLQRLGLRMLLADRPGLTVVGEAATGTDAVRMSTALRADVVLLASDLPGTNTVETVRRIARPDAAGVSGGHPARVLLLAPAGPAEYPYAALRAGAGGCLPEDATPDQLASAVRSVAAGDAVITPGLTRALIDAVRRQRRPAAPEPPIRLDTLTARERDVLTAVAAGWSNAEIAQRLSIAPTTVKSHVSNILTKTGARARVQAVVFAYESGLVRPA